VPQGARATEEGVDNMFSPRLRPDCFGDSETTSSGDEKMAHRIVEMLMFLALTASLFATVICANQ
jgi:hypothetical protein